MRTLIASVMMFVIASTGFGAAVTNAIYGGSYSGWASSWTALSGLNDPNDGVKGRLDFVGNATNPGAYVASDNNYLYFRIRVNATGDEVRADEWQDSIWIMVDDLGRGVADKPDYAFAWDTKGRWSDSLLVPNAEHGLELQTNQTSGASWNNIVMNDVDGNVAKKLVPPDFNTTGNGYIRTIDSQATTAFGLTTFVDFAVSWNYLSAQSTLAQGQTWRIQLASRADATDHNAPTTDIAGGASPSSLISTWSAPVAIPEPASIMMIAFGGGLIFLIRRFYGRG